MWGLGNGADDVVYFCYQYCSHKQVYVRNMRWHCIDNLFPLCTGRRTMLCHSLNLPYPAHHACWNMEISSARSCNEEFLLYLEFRAYLIWINGLIIGTCTNWMLCLTVHMSLYRVYHCIMEISSAYIIMQESGFINVIWI